MKSPKPKARPVMSSPRPKARPPMASAKPKARPSDMMEGEAVAAGNRAAQRQAKDYEDFVEKKAKGGMCRGMGAAKKGGKYGKSG